ncbi:MAG: hypothetical protein JWN02_1040 [Acidobacteria bacterium]|nr:hypothetical protein [Acidobacteriota bacterium]
MKWLLIIAACLSLTPAARGQGYTVRIQETAIIEIAGATAAYTTNPTIADVTVAASGRLALTGQSSGSTQLVVITAGGTQSYLITVALPRPSLEARPEPGIPVARYDGRYTSGTGRLQNAVDIVADEGKRRSELHVLQLHDLQPAPGERSDSFPLISYRHTSPGRQLTLLDEMVNLSPITISRTQVRGLHLRQGSLELHGGYASSTRYDGLFLPSDRRWVAGAGYGIDFRSTRWTPSVYGFFSQPAGTAARRGLVGALAVEHRQGQNLLLRGEVGVSRSLAVAGEAGYSSPRGQLRALLSVKGDDFPTLGLADLPGRHLEIDGTFRATDHMSMTSYGSFDSFPLAAQRQTIEVASVGLSYAVTQRLALLGGADVSAVRTSTSSIRTIGLPLGMAYEAQAFGLAASYRLLDDSAASRRGDALRLSAHGSVGPFSGSVWGERQRQAPTLELIFRSEPGLELALLRLGISARTPEEVARALRENTALIALGFITGVNVDLTPRRLQAGFNLAWLGTGPRHDSLHLVTVYGRDEGVSGNRDSLLATLNYSRRVLAATDLYGSYSWWRTGVGAQEMTGTSVEIGLRHQFAGLPTFLQRSGTIEGVAFLDPQMLGVRSEGSEALPGLLVTLDGGRPVRTDSKGAYSFRQVAAGPHEVAAQLPSSARAFFTTPSHSEPKVPARVDFGVVWATARIDGHVTSDDGAVVAGVTLSAAAQNGLSIVTTSDSEGRFVFAVPPGTLRVALIAESLPPGYSITGEGVASVTVSVDQPQALSLEVRPIRTVAGRVVGASEAGIESLGRSARVDASGNFVFRSMPAGTFTITALSGGRAVSRVVTLGSGPETLSGVVLGAPATMAVSASAAEASASPAIPRGVVSDRTATRVTSAGSGGCHVVQAGVFREERNARKLFVRLLRRGERPFIVDSHGLTVIYVGPFETHQGAVAAGERLRLAGFEGFVTQL